MIRLNLKAVQLWWKKIQTGDVASVHAEVAELVNSALSPPMKAYCPTAGSAVAGRPDSARRKSRWFCGYADPRMSKTIESRPWHRVMGLAHHMIVAHLFISHPGKAER